MLVQMYEHDIRTYNYSKYSQLLVVLVALCYKLPNEDFVLLVSCIVIIEVHISTYQLINYLALTHYISPITVLGD